MNTERKEYTPRPWQVPMLRHLLNHPRCALWAGMGLGKTTVVLSYLEIMYFCGEDAPTLIVGPLRVARKVWHEEAEKWRHLEKIWVVPIVGTVAQRLAAVKRDAPIFTVNYEALPWLVQYWGARWPYKTVVADEADALKGHRASFRAKPDAKGNVILSSGGGTSRASALAKVAHTYVQNFIELTGTPAPNGLKDLWGQMWFLDRGARLGRTHTDFAARWFRTGFNGFGLLANEGAKDSIHGLVSDLCLTVCAEDWVPLDKPIVNNVYVTLPDDARSAYKELEESMFLKLTQDFSVSVSNAAVLTSKLLQVANGALYIDDDGDAPTWHVLHDAKIDALRSIVAETGGAPLMVCYEFRSDRERLVVAFPKARVLRTKQDEDDFTAGKVSMLLLHPKSGGHGINGFERCCRDIVFFGHNWSLGQYLQVVERIGPTRQMQSGHPRAVYIHHIIAEDTIDGLVMERRESKKSVQEILLAACKRYDQLVPKRSV